MTDAMMGLNALLEKTTDADMLRKMIGFATGRLMALEVGALTGSGYGEKTRERLAQRNGYRERDWHTRAGTVELRIPKLRKGSYSPGLPELRRMAEKALTAAIKEACGLSYRPPRQTALDTPHRTAQQQNETPLRAKNARSNGKIMRCYCQAATHFGNVLAMRSGCLGQESSCLKN